MPDADPTTSDSATRSPLRLSVLLSGGGRTLENLAECCRSGELPAQIVQVVSSHPEAYGLQRAARFSIPTEVVSFRDYPRDATGYSEALTRVVDAASPDLVLLAGFLRRWSFPPRYEGRVLNIHPALLPTFGGPGFFGERVHRAVLAAGVKFSGCTVHFASQEYDDGPIILQRVVPVADDDTPDSLAARVFEQECIAYPEAVRLFAEGRLRIDNGRVRLREPQSSTGDSPGGAC